MDYLQEVLARIGNRVGGHAKLIVEYHFDYSKAGNHFSAHIVDEHNRGWLETVKSHSLNTTIGTLDKLAEDWLVENEP